MEHWPVTVLKPAPKTSVCCNNSDLRPVKCIKLQQTKCYTNTSINIWQPWYTSSSSTMKLPHSDAVADSLTSISLLSDMLYLETASCTFIRWIDRQSSLIKGPCCSCISFFPLHPPPSLYNMIYVSLLSSRYILNKIAFICKPQQCICTRKWKKYKTDSYPLRKLITI
jgi:hypothetical protein